MVSVFHESLFRLHLADFRVTNETSLEFLLGNTISCSIFVFSSLIVLTPLSHCSARVGPAGRPHEEK